MIRRPAIQTATLDTRHVRHDFEFGVQTTAAGGAELRRALASGWNGIVGVLGRGFGEKIYPVFVDFATGAGSVVVFGLAFGDVEVGAGDDDVGGVGCACPGRSSVYSLPRGWDRCIEECTIFGSLCSGIVLLLLARLDSARG